MKKQLLILTLLFLTVIINAQELKSVYVLSEGGFSPATSQLGLLNAETNIFNNSIFNPGNLGSYPDGIFLNEEKIYLTEQGNWGGAGKAYVLNHDGTMEKSADVGLNPYSLTFANDKLYITNGAAGNVSVLDADDLSLVKTISVGVYPQEIYGLGNYVFVANTSAYLGDSDSTVSVIDTSTDEVISTITVGKDPSSFALANDGNLLVGCPGDQNSGVIYKINPVSFAKIDSFSVDENGFGKEISVDKNSDKIYYISSFNHIVELDLVSSESRIIVNSTFGVNYFYGYSFDYIKKEHYVLDAKDFSITGEMYLYDNNGTLLNTFSTGIAPRRVVLNYSQTPTNVEDNIILPLEFSLKQNYPNPFNPSTIISYQLSEISDVELRVYNNLGEIVAKLISGTQQAGNYNVSFDASSLSSGVYIYSLLTNGQVLSKKMTLIK